MAKRISKRPSRARAKRKPKFPEIEALSEEERKDLWDYAWSLRVEERRYAIEDVVDEALAYHAETQRDDDEHDYRHAPFITSQEVRS